MSVKYISWALDLEQIDASHKMVLIVLANRANDDGECWPGQASIAEQASMGERTVRRKLDALEEAGYITRRRRGHGEGAGGRSTDVYLLHLGVTGQLGRKPLTGQLGQLTGQLRQTYRPLMADKTSLEPSDEPSELSPASPSELSTAEASYPQVRFLGDLHMLAGGWQAPEFTPRFDALTAAEADHSIQEALAFLDIPENRNPPPLDHPTYAKISPRARSLIGRWRRDRCESAN